MSDDVTLEDVKLALKNKKFLSIAEKHLDQDLFNGQGLSLGELPREIAIKLKLAEIIAPPSIVSELAKELGVDYGN